MSMPVNDLLASVGGLLLKNGNVVFKPFGLTVRTFAILNRLARAELTNSELCALDMDSASAVAQKVKLLVARGLVSRRTDKADGRVSHLSLTTAGRRLHESVLPSYARALEPLYAELDPADVQAVERVLTILKARLAGREGDHAS